ncbi:uncharacterized protein At4g18490-like isoform X1 [Salvia miltiorrhiza]|uniref:uncharacterized protein At4g18490-like isoform X1 n=1 Tax=Salvia miltiorrhiza TaxID=226208 RepID=UPI0025ABCA44|nr:uncharacterized protein At4g18490-like isoform X1 [Salvia miltiorrhiza]
MADPQKNNRVSVNVKEKDPLQDLEIGNDFFSWKSMSIGEGDGLDFDIAPVSKGNKKLFNFEKADMDFNLDADFGKMSSFNLDISDLDNSPPLKKDAKSKEKPQESSSGKNKGKTDRFAFGFDFDELDDFSFDSPKKEGTKAQSDNKESSSNGSGCQDKEGSTHINETGSKSTSKDGPQKPSLPESRITFDMDFEPTREICPSNFAMDDIVTQEHLAAIDEGPTGEVKGPLETTISREIPNISPSKKLVSRGQVDLEACITNDVMLDLSSDHLSNDEPSGCNSSALENKVDSVDANASGSNGEQDGNMTLVADSTFSYKHTISRNSQHHQAVAVSENIDETSVDNSSAGESKVSCMDTNASSLNGEQDANMVLVAGSPCDYEHTSKASEHDQPVVFSENINGERTQDGIENHAEEDRERAELGQTNSLVEISCTTGDVSGISCDSDTQSSRENQEPSHEMIKSSLTSEPADPLAKPIENITEPLMNFSRPSVQLEKPECPIPKASIQATFSSLSSKQITSAQPSLVKGRNGDAAQSDRKLSLQCSKTLLRGIIPQIQSQKSCSHLNIYGREDPVADGSRNGSNLNDSSAKQVKDMEKIKSAPRQREVFTKDLDNPRMETNSKAAESSGNPKILASILSNKNTSAQEHRTSATEGGRKPPDLSGLKLSRLSIDSTKSPILREIKPVGNSSQKSVSVSKIPFGTAHLSDQCRQTISTLSVKRALEDDTADTSALHPAKRLSQSVATSRNFLETTEKVLKKAPINRMEDDRIKSTIGNSHELKAKGVEISSSTKNDSNIKLADACSKELDDLCDILRKKHDEAKELLAQAILNNNKLLMLNNPQLDEKISFKLSTSTDFVGSIFIIHANTHCVGLYY